MSPLYSNSTGSPPKKHLAEELLVLDDQQLDQYLEENQHVVQVEDPDNLPEDFIQRLRDRVWSPKVPALDLAQVDARLLSALQKPTATPFQEVSSTTASTLSPEPVEDSERDAYRTLILDGGRPAYPPSLVEAVCANASAFPDLVSPWITDQWDWQFRPRVFEKQVACWREFRAWQYCVRKRRPEDGIANMTPACEAAARLFNRFRTDRSMAGYARAAKDGVRDLCNIDAHFKPLWDPKRQDPLTTWLEYVVSTHWLFKACTDNATNCEARCREAWERLVQSDGFLPPEEEESDLTEDGHDYQSGRRHDTAVALNEVINTRLASREARYSGEARLSDTVGDPLPRFDEAESTLRQGLKRSVVGKWLKVKHTYERRGSQWQRLATWYKQVYLWAVQQVAEVRSESSGKRRLACQTTSVPLRRSPRLSKRQHESSDLREIPTGTTTYEERPARKKRRVT